MKFKLPESFVQKQKEIFEKKYIDINGEKVHVSELKDRSVTSDMKESMRMNSYANDDMPPKLTNEAIIKTAEHYLENCSQPRYPCVTYEEALIHRIMPELIKRLKEDGENGEN